MVNWTKIKCFFGFHKFIKMGGPSNLGNGQFKQRLICSECKKIKDYIR